MFNSFKLILAEKSHQEAYLNKFKRHHEHCENKLNQPAARSLHSWKSSGGKPNDVKNFFSRNEIKKNNAPSTEHVASLIDHAGCLVLDVYFEA